MELAGGDPPCITPALPEDVLSSLGHVAYKAGKVCPGLNFLCVPPSGNVRLGAKVRLDAALRIVRVQIQGPMQMRKLCEWQLPHEVLQIGSSLQKPPHAVHVQMHLDQPDRLLHALMKDSPWLSTASANGIQRLLMCHCNMRGPAQTPWPCAGD